MTIAHPAYNELHPPISGTFATLARRYAAALYTLAEEQNRVAAIAESMMALKQAINHNDDLHNALNEQNIDPKQLSAALQQIAQDADASPLLVNFLGVIAEERRAVLLPLIAQEVIRLHDKHIGKTTVLVTTALPMSQDQQTKLAHKLAKDIGGTVTLNIHEDSDLLGGFILQWGSNWIDASLRGRLQSMKQHLQEGV